MQVVFHVWDAAMDRDLSNRQWVENWRRVGALLEQIRCAELQNFDYAQNREIIDSLLDMGCRHAVSRNTSGLVELERWLMKKSK